MLAGKVAIITGAGRGVGKAAALMLAREGAQVIVNDLGSEVARETVEEIRQAGGKALSCAGDVTDKNFPDQLVQFTLTQYGRVDILVNNAGYTWDAPIHKMTDEQWYAMIDVHATAPFRLIRAVAPYMRQAAKDEAKLGLRHHRKIINVTSVSGVVGNAGQANYAAAKAALIGLTKTVAKEWGRFFINCNAVALGLIETRLSQEKERQATLEGTDIKIGIPKEIKERFISITPLVRTGTIMEAAGAILFLSSAFSDYITGQVIHVDGGMWM